MSPRSIAALTPPTTARASQRPMMNIASAKTELADQRQEVTSA